MKSMSQLYRQMEEDVAKKVHETMELANAKRRAFAKEGDKFNQTEDTTQSSGTVQELETLDASVQTIESIAGELTGHEDDADVLRAAKAATAKKNFLTTATHNVADFRKKDNSPQFHIGFEHIRDNVDKKQISSAGQSTQLPYLLDDQRQLALDALTLAQTAAKNVDNRFYVADEPDKRQLAEGALNLAQNAAWNIDNRHYETDDQRRLAEGALSLAQNAARNVDNKVHESDQRQLPEGEMNINDKQDPWEGELNFALAEGALNLAKNAAWKIDNKLEADNDKRGLAEGALSLAQNAVRNIDNEVYEIEGDKRGIAEGALRLAQKAAKDLDEVQTTGISRRELAEGALSRDDADGKLSREGRSDSFESTTVPENQNLQLGFGYFAALHDVIKEDAETGKVLDEINKKTLAEYDKRTISAAQSKIRQLSEDLQNLEIDLDNNNYDATEVDESKKLLAEGALNLAQMGARHIGEQIHETSDSKIRELGEGALSLAQSAAKKQLAKEGAERSLDDACFKNLTDEHKPRLQLGFEQSENTSVGELQAESQGQHSLRLQGSKRHALKDLEGSGDSSN